MSTRSFLTVIALVLALAAGAGVLLIGQNVNQAGAGGKALIGGPFSLVDQRGERVTEKDFEGRFMLAYFGYTFCPDFCPLGLSTITEALELLPEEEADKVAPVFFTVDPARDTVEQLADYVTHFHPNLQGLTGTEEEVATAAKAYRIYYNIPEDAGDDYAVDHSTFTYLMGPDGTYRTHFGHDTTPEELAERLKSELEKG
ncbi:MAG: SCO family protein [Pseudomonadota bacterium]